MKKLFTVKFRVININSIYISRGRGDNLGREEQRREEKEGDENIINNTDFRGDKFIF